jgi:hypothetical protein
MAINGYFFNAVNSGGVYDRVYNAEDVTSYLDKLVGSGVFPNPSTQLQVRAGTGMQVIVASGQGWINGHKIINTADMPLTIDAADALLNRIDRVIFYADFTNREMGISVKKGTAATSPSAPALTRDTTRYEMSLATVKVNKQVTAITQGNITDTRADTSVCGWVTGLIQQVDTATLFTQWQTAYSDYYDESTQEFESWETSMKSQFDTWLSELTQELGVNTYVDQFVKSVAIGQSDSKVVALNMTGYTYEQTDIFYVYINGLMATETTDYTVDTTGATPTITFLFNQAAGITNEVEIRILKSIIGFSTT